MNEPVPEGAIDEHTAAPHVRPPRKNLLLSAAIRSEGVTAPVRIRNVSEKGAMVDGDALPETGATLVLQRLDIEMRGVVVWRANGRCGIRFDGAASVDEWVVGRRTPAATFGHGQLRVDQIQAAIRSGQAIADDEPPPSGDPDVPLDVEARIADELDYVQRMLDEVANDLIGDALLLQRHGQALQYFDNACQILGHLSAVLKADDRPAAITGITLEALRARLQRKPNF